MARKLPASSAHSGPTALAAVAYGEVGSSLYFALGIVALYALGLTPVVLLVVGALFLLVAAVVRGGRGRDPGDRRRSHVRAAGVQRPARLRHRLGAVPRLPDRRGARRPVHAALRRRPRSAGSGLTHRPWDALVGVLVILGLAASRLVRRTQLYRVAVGSGRRRLATHVLLIVLGGVFVLSREGFWSGSARHRPELGRARVRAAARDAGLHRARDGGQLRRPRRASRARRFRAGVFAGPRDRRRRLGASSR